MDALFLTTVNGGPLIMRPNNCWEELMSAISLLNYIVLKKKKGARRLGSGGVLLILGFIDFFCFLSVAKQRDGRHGNCEKVCL